MECEHVNVEYFCKVCQKRHKLKIELDELEQKNFPISYAYLHGDPMILATLFLDADFKVRGVEYAHKIGINEDQLNNILEKSKESSLLSIPEEYILGLQLMEENEIRKLYVKKGASTPMNFSEITKIWRFAKKFSKKDDELVEFFLKYSDFWIAGMEMMDYEFLLVVDSKIDIQHLKTQMVAIFETILQ